VTPKTKVLQYYTFNNNPVARKICIEKYISKQEHMPRQQEGFRFSSSTISQMVALELPIGWCFIWMSSGLQVFKLYYLQMVALELPIS
jgi:hypothetical protein